MVVPGQWFVDNSKNPKKSDGGLKSEKRMLSAIFALNFSQSVIFILTSKVGRTTVSFRR